MHHRRSGLAFEKDGHHVVDVDLSAHTIVVLVGRRTRTELALSRRGLEDATRAVRLCCGLRLRGRATDVALLPASHSAAVQEHLFGVTPATEIPEDIVDDAERLSQLLSAAILARATAVAREREPRIDDVMAAVARERATPLPLSKAALRVPFLASDVLRFRPAAVAMALLETQPVASATPACVETLTRGLSSWRGFFAPDRKPTRALNKTLERHGADADAVDLQGLAQIELVRPVESALHLRVLAARVRLGDGAPLQSIARFHVAASVDREAERQRQLRLLQLASEPELVELIDRVARALRMRDSDDAARVHLFVEFLARSSNDVADVSSLSAAVVGALRPRRRVRAGLIRGSADDGHLEPLASPPVPLPDVAGLTFLRTAAELIDEGVAMEHCVATRINAAMRGDAFLFHYRAPQAPRPLHDVACGEADATVEVSRFGDVVESQSRGNRSTTASRRAHELLRRWGAGFWAARVGASLPPQTASPLQRCCWQPGRATVPPDTGWPAVRPLLTVGDCLDAFHQVADVADDPLHVLVDWFETNVAAAIQGRCWLIATAEARAGAGCVAVAGVHAIDERGATLARCGHFDGDERISSAGARQPDNAQAAHDR